MNTNITDSRILSAGRQAVSQSFNATKESRNPRHAQFFIPGVVSAYTKQGNKNISEVTIHKDARGKVTVKRVDFNGWGTQSLARVVDADSGIEVTALLALPVD